MASDDSEVLCESKSYIGIESLVAVERVKLELLERLEVDDGVRAIWSVITVFANVG